MTPDGRDLQTKFRARMVAIYRRAVAECDYRPTYFLKMVKERGGIGAARALLHAAAPAQGLMTLWEKQRLDLSVEALVLQAPWSSLFSDEELATARKRLRDLGYSA